LLLRLPDIHHDKMEGREGREGRGEEKARHAV
jgi:hypothetical protein